MYIHYDKENDYLEFFFEITENFADQDEENEHIVIFKNEKNNNIVGYAIEEASKKIIAFDKINSLDKMSILLKISRLKRNLSQDEVAKHLNISLRHYQRLENGQDTTVSLLYQISKFFPETHFSSLFEMKKSA